MNEDTAENPQGNQAPETCWSCVSGLGCSTHGIRTTGDVECPNNTPWCTEHQVDEDQCVSPAIQVATSYYVWLLQELPGIEPVIVADGPPTAAQLSLLEASDMQAALEVLRRAAMDNKPVAP